MKNYLIYLAYGSADHYNELMYSLVSFYKFHPKDAVSILIYTDDSSFINGKIPDEITLKILDNKTLSLWKGAVNFNHRLKVKVLQDAHSNYTGNFLFVDTDTYFTQNCSDLFQKINNNGVVMDLCEGRLIDNTGGIARKTRKVLKKQNQFSLASDTEIVTIDHEFTVWNSGVIGFNSNFSKLHLVEELVDQLYSKGKLFVMEQIAFNYYLQQYKTPFSAGDYIHHYWYFKEFRGILRHFFSHHQGKSLEELIPEIDKINPETLAKEKVEYKKMSFFKKQWHKIIHGRKWKISDYKL